MVVHTGSPRVQHARRLVLEMLGSSVDLSTAPELQRLMGEYGAKPERYGQAAVTAERDLAVTGHHTSTPLGQAASVHHGNGVALRPV